LIKRKKIKKTINERKKLERPDVPAVCHNEKNILICKLIQTYERSNKVEIKPMLSVSMFDSQSIKDSRKRNTYTNQHKKRKESSSTR
jgi:hypothetical protein